MIDGRPVGLPSIILIHIYITRKGISLYIRRTEPGFVTTVVLILSRHAEEGSSASIWK